MRKAEKLTEVLSLSIRFSYQSDQAEINVSQKIEPTQNTFDLQDELIYIFRKKYRGRAVRQIGVGAGRLSSEHIKHLSLFEAMIEDDETHSHDHEKEAALQKEIDDIRDTFDFSAIQKASALTKGSRTFAPNKMIGGHAAAQDKREIKMVVDRSYSDFEAIRNYQDRGMMKWGTFATG